MIGQDIQTAKQYLDNGQLVAIPTETVYGLAGNALNEKAVLEIFKVKQRPSFDPLIVHTDSWDKLHQFVTEVPEQATLLAQHLVPGAITFLLPKKSIVPDLVTSGLPLVAVRIPAHPLALALLKTLAYPLAAPSANPFGYISPTTALHVAQQLGDKIPYILDGGACQIGVESTIIGFEGGVPTIYRKGGIAIEVIENLIGKVQLQEHSSSNPKAPGQLKSHYAPHTPFELLDRTTLLKNLADTPHKNKLAILSFQDYVPTVPLENQRVLSSTGNFAEAARHLFAYMRELDALGYEAIWAEQVPDVDLGRAINDRLRRAAAR